MLVDRGRLSYDDLVVEYWPEYGQFGKENTTIEDVLTHKVGSKKNMLQNVLLETFLHTCSILVHFLVRPWPIFQESSGIIH